MTDRPRTLGVVLFPDFESLDVFGPVEMFGNLTGLVNVTMVAREAGPVRTAQGPRVIADHGIASCPPLDLVMVPGGVGTREAIADTALLAWLRAVAASAELVMSVCTGTELLAQAGLLDGRRATTNKMLFTRLESEWPAVQWVREARWVEDGKFVTSSGVSAGMDMALAVIGTLIGPQASEALATGTEYEWHRDAGWDPFAKIHNLV
jgi:transcriptional regulator GlxA family with amidase domain